MKNLKKIYRYVLILKIMIGITFLPSSVIRGQETIIIDASQKYQIIEGIGGTIGRSEIPRGDRTFDLMVNDLGISIARIRFPAGFEIQNDNDDPNVFNWDAFDPFREVADGSGDVRGEFNWDSLDRILGLVDKGFNRFMVTPWGVPGWLMSSGSVGGGGGIDGSKAAEYAEMMSAFVQYMNNNYGVNIEYVSPLNEPDMGVYVSAGPNTIRTLVQALREKFARDGLSTKIIAPEIGAWNLSSYYGVFSVGDPGTPDVFAYHYGGKDNYGDIWDMAHSLNVPVWGTEFDGAWEGIVDTHEEAMVVAVDLHHMLTLGNHSGLVFWKLWSKTDTPRGARQRLYNPDSGASPKYYAYKQYCRYITQGSRRVYTSGDSGGDILTSAYLHPDGTFIIVAINDGFSSVSVNFVLNNLNLDTLDKIRYSESENSQYVGNISVSGRSFTDTLPSSSITTYTTQSYNIPPLVDLIPPMPPTGVRVNNP